MNAYTSLAAVASAASLGSIRLFALDISLSDIVDVLVIAVLLYIVLRLLLETRSLSVAIGILILGALYEASAVFGLSLTNTFLKSFFGFFIIFIAIIFQKELRRLFSFVGFFSFQRAVPPAQATIQTLVRAAAELSARQIGALIVLPGRESLARHLDRGIALNGALSQELLLSIFSEETPGHDGAIVVEHDTIRSFGVHLPLTDIAERLGAFGGLRHRAALGLSERSDAFVIVVSGETGSIDVAQRGSWEHCATAGDLREKLDSFAYYVRPKRDRAYLARWVKENVLTFGASLAIACIAWAASASNFSPTQKNFSVSPQFLDLPAGYVVRDFVPRQVILSLKGKNIDFESLSPQSLSVSIDLSAVKSVGWKTIPLKNDSAEVPGNFSVIQTAPTSIQVEIAKEP